MQNFKSHFKFSKQQRNGIFSLVVIIIGLQCMYFFVDFSSEDIKVDQTELAKLQKEIDSLRRIKLEASKPRIYPFNPNYISDYKGATLGMHTDEIDRLHAFRKQNKWINSAKQFQDVTKVSDSLLNRLSPFFKFPEWVNNKKTKRQQSTNTKLKKLEIPIEKLDLNTATAAQLQEVNGLGEKLSQRIVRFRNTFKGGFIDDIQLEDVYGLSAEVIKEIKIYFTVKTPRQIKKINLNTATVEALTKIQHINYELANNIIEQRKLREGFKSLSELKKVKDFPINKIKIIELYLHLEKEHE